MMRFTVYVRIEGENFDPHGFNQSLASERQGEVGIRRGARGVARPLAYWRSPCLQTDRLPEEAVEVLLRRYEAELLDAKEKVGASVSVQVVNYYRDGDTPSGFYFSRALVQLLTRLDADLDIDAAIDLAVDDSSEAR